MIIIIKTKQQEKLLIWSVGSSIYMEYILCRILCMEILITSQ